MMRWLRNLFWLPYWLWLKLEFWFLQRKVRRLRAENARLREKLGIPPKEGL